MLADELDYVLGVDTHRDEHVVAVVTALLAQSLLRPERRGQRSPATRSSYTDASTRDYIARRIAEGKTKRDATRLLKRYLADTCNDEGGYWSSTVGKGIHDEQAHRALSGEHLDGYFPADSCVA